MTVSAPHYLLFSESNTPRTAESRHARRDPSSGRWRFVLETVDGRTRFEAADEEFESEEGRLALLAVVRGLESLEQPSRVTVVTPSRYVSRGFLFGLQEWRENGWRWERFGEMTPIKNRDLWQRIDRAMQFHHVECRVWRFDMPETTETAPAAETEPASAPRRRRLDVASPLPSIAASRTRARMWRSPAGTRPRRGGKWSGASGSAAAVGCEAIRGCKPPSRRVRNSR